MKKLLFLGLVLLTFCSCGKNYPQMVKDKVEQYKKEGKIILNQSNDSTGKEHYIVYADVKSQTIGVDTLGEKAKEIKLGKKTFKKLTLHANEGAGLVAKFSVQEYDETKEYKLLKNGQLMAYNQPMDITVYKDKYIIIGKNKSDSFYPDAIFVNGEEDAYYQICGTFGTDEVGNLNVSAETWLRNAVPESWRHYIEDSYNHPELYIDINHGNIICKTTISPDGKIIKQSDVVVCDYLQIPVEVFSSWSTLKLYVYKIVNGTEDAFDPSEIGMR